MKNIYESDKAYMLKVLSAKARTDGNIITEIPANLGSRIYVHSPKVDIRHTPSKFRASLMVLRVWPDGVDEKLLQ